MRPNATTRYCARCGAGFPARPSDPDRYCGRACYSIIRRERAERGASDRFWSHVDKGGPTVRPELGPCWVWIGSRHRNGYGQSTSKLDKEGLAHRRAWTLTNGPIPGGLHVLHRCDNRPCVRPEHLFLGTHTDNCVDMWTKDRHPRSATLTTTDVRAIRDAAASGTSRAALAAQYGVHYMTVTDVVRRRTWKHVD